MLGVQVAAGGCWAVQGGCWGVLGGARGCWGLNSSHHVVCHHSGFRNRHHLSDDERAFNLVMAREREFVEHVIGEIRKYWQFVGSPSKLAVYQIPVHKIYTVSGFMYNLMCCFRGFTGTERFRCPPMTVREYIAMGREGAYAPA